MAVTYSIRFSVEPAQRERFLALLDEVLDAMREEPMFHLAMLQQSAEDEHRFLLLETWEDHDDVIANQLTRPYRQPYIGALPELLVEPAVIEVWSPRRADVRRT